MVSRNPINMWFSRILFILANILVIALATPTNTTVPDTPKPPPTTNPSTQTPKKTTPDPYQLEPWPKAYSVEGEIRLPYVPIYEPFEAYVDKSETVGKSRIDYYKGTMKTIQSDGGDFGIQWKISYETDDQNNIWNELQCFQAPGFEEMPAEAQDVLPEVSSFTHIGTDRHLSPLCHTVGCEMWSFIDKDARYPNKYSNYTLWTYTDDAIQTPLKYEMMGVNNLFGSHYDHYIMFYMNYKVGKPNATLFDPKTLIDTPCGAFPGPGIGDHTYTFNPMSEFVHGRTSHVDQAFDEFVEKHNKEHSHEHEQEAKKDVFRQNMRMIHSVNRKNLSYKLAPNHLTDTTEEERKHLTGKFKSPAESRHGSNLVNRARSFEYTQQDVDDLPAFKNWTAEGAVNRPADQAICGSCWSFGTAGTLEGAYFVKHKELLKFSEQALIDCSWGQGNNGCDGGEEWRAFEWMMNHGGIPTDESYGTYLGINGKCHFNSTEMKFDIDHYVNVTANNVTALKVALNKYGPIAVDIMAGQTSLSFYSSGVWHDEKCNTDAVPYPTNHAVLLVGYGQDNSTGKPQDYWLIKNSWSSHWGDEGYVKIAQKPNDCGVSTTPSFAKMKPWVPSTAKPVPPKTDSSGASALSFTFALLALLISVTQLNHLS